MRARVFLLLGLAACAELKAAAGDEPTPSVDPTPPASTKSTNKLATSHPTDEAAESDAPLPSPWSPATHGGGTDAGSSTDATPNEGANPNATRLCTARCAHEATCAKDDTNGFRLACMFACVDEFGARAAHFNDGFLATLDDCFGRLACEAAAETCLDYSGNPDEHAVQAIRGCQAAVAECPAIDPDIDCGALDRLDVSTQKASAACFLESCNDIATCFAKARGE